MVRRTCHGLAAIACALLLSACGPASPPAQDELRFTRLDGGEPGRAIGPGADTTGLAQGAPLVERVAVVRHDNGLVQVRGESRLPAGTRLQLTLRPAGGDGVQVATTVTIAAGAFISDPLLADGRPLPTGDYVVDLMATFEAGAQDESVRRATRSGMALRGPGVTRDRHGAAVLVVHESARL